MEGGSQSCNPAADDDGVIVFVHWSNYISSATLLVERKQSKPR
jgi:hypothetical protein